MTTQLLQQYYLVTKKTSGVVTLATVFPITLAFTAQVGELLDKCDLDIHSRRVITQNDNSPACQCCLVTKKMKTLSRSSHHSSFNQVGDLLDENGLDVDVP